MTDLRGIVFSSDIGWICATWICSKGKRELLHELTFGHASPEAAVRSLRHGDVSPTAPIGSLRRFSKRLQSFLRQPDDDFLDIELDLSEYTPFRRRIVNQCRAIAVGETRSYAELAKLAGHPGAARATGQVMATNRFSLIVPCHRVVGSGGSIGGFSAPDGLNMKRRLLELENVARRSAS